MRARLPLLIALAPAALVCVASEVRAAPLEVEVTAQSGRAVFLDQGRRSGLSIGDRVTFRPPGGGEVVYVVHAVSSRSARCEPVAAGGALVPVGSRGVAEIQAPAASAEEPEKADAGPQNLSGVWTRADGARYYCADSGARLVLRRELPPGSALASFVVQLRREGTTLSGIARFRLVKDPVEYTLSWQLTRVAPRVFEGRLEVLDFATGRRSFETQRFTVTPKGTKPGDTTRPKSGEDFRPPEHPGWKDTPEGWDKNQPLLAPARARTASERELLIRGRVYAQYVHSVAGERRDQFMLGRTGGDLTIENPFGYGGRVQAAAEGFYRGSEVEGSDDSSTTSGRIRRLSYAIGGDRERPWRIELGRFLHSEMAGLGVVDGVELSTRLFSIHTVGASFGFLPKINPRMDTGEDLQASLFYRLSAGDEQQVSVGVAGQKTWHEGKADRDLLVLDLALRPIRSVSITGGAFVDLYGSGDEVKSGAELTRGFGTARWEVVKGQGLGVTGSYTRVPELLRDDFRLADVRTLEDLEVLRYGVFTWHEFTTWLRLDARADRWQDQNDDGATFELTATLRDLLFPRGSVAGTVFTTSGISNDGVGGRLTLTKSFDSLTTTLSYTVTSYEFREGETLGRIQHLVQGSLDWSVTSRLSLSISGNYQKDEEQSAFSGGFFIQRRF